MGFRLPELPEDFPAATVLGVASIAIAAVASASLSRNRGLDAIPTVGSSRWVGFRYLSDAADMIQEGYAKYKSAPFKVRELYHWTVIVSKREHIEELRRAPDDVLSFNGATNTRLHTHYTLGSEATSGNPYHIAVIRSQLTRNIRTLYPEVRDEVVTAFNEILDLKGNEWKSVSALNAMRQVVCRTSNRLFVGLPLCRNPDWIDLNIQYSLDVFNAGTTIALYPKLIRPIAAYLFAAPTSRGRARAQDHMDPIIRERLKHFNEHGNNWVGKPNDLLTWLIEEADSSQLTVKSLTSHMMLVNFAAIHTTSNSLTTALFFLAANPQFIQPLREEIEAIIEKEGWSKESLGSMHKVDSFLRECQRFDGSGIVGLSRKAVKDFMFSDGTFIPKGTMIGVASRCLHHDDRFYENADEFEPFRFADMRNENGNYAKCQFVSVGSEYLPFGYGKHACPGRFFVASELKSMLAHIVVTYDVKLEGDETRPRSVRYGVSVRANPHARVLFRRRFD